MHKSEGNSIAFDDAVNQEYEITDPKGQVSRHKAMGADVMRWMYCRQNPAQNINFGPDPADELRSKFVLKLWNTYAFFCNYASAEWGGFDLSAPQVPDPRAAGHRPLDPVGPARTHPDGSAIVRAVRRAGVLPGGGGICR